MLSAKKKLKECVETYIMLCPEEFGDFKLMMEQRRSNLKDNKFAEGSDGLRGLFEMPETLHEIIVKQLSDEELSWFKSGGANHKEGARWFAKSFPVFTLPSSI